MRIKYKGANERADIAFNQDATDEATSTVQSTRPEVFKAAFSQGGGGMQLMRCEKRRRWCDTVPARNDCTW